MNFVHFSIWVSTFIVLISIGAHVKLHKDADIPTITQITTGAVMAISHFRFHQT